MPGKMNTGVGNRFDAPLSLKLNVPIGSLTHWTGSYWRESSKPNLIQRTPHPKPHGYDVSRLTLPDCHPRPKKFKNFWQTTQRMLTSAWSIVYSTHPTSVNVGRVTGWTSFGMRKPADTSSTIPFRVHISIAII